MKLGIVGSGMIVKDLLQTISQISLEKLAIYGRNLNTVRQLAADHNISEMFTHYEEMLASDLDTLYIALPNHLHFSFTKQALLAGKNIILEKPITSNYAEFIELCEIARTQNKMLLEAVTVHYLPAYQKIKEKLTALGQIKIVNLNYSQYSSRYDRFKAGEVPPVFDPQKSGGALMDLNVYNLHFAVGLFGAPQHCLYLANIERNIDTSGVVLLDYPQFKVICIGAKDCAAPVTLSIQGDKGNIAVPMPANAMNCFTLTENNGHSETFQFEERHRMFYEFQRFVEIIDSGDHNTAQQMLAISGIVCQLTEQARKQQGILFAGEK
ncbi:Gfo/Idh/MocA family protein [Rodentibacter myodis]|uniref:NAD(P)-dependent oxidoreductase n=1 Tax=Rodentibacter myodis TaxID=1907939 RepID=A0A1V3JKS8_9PAST|nr:Gfo/Idh/MocA family oxidoreductase [Rodentibacter myodis]OOF57284.1 NAD(P)-dependent oxidoreductase [Rodentibacter myodis]